MGPRPFLAAAIRRARIVRCSVVRAKPVLRTRASTLLSRGNNGIRGQEMKTDGFYRLLTLPLKRATEPRSSFWIRVWYDHRTVLLSKTPPMNTAHIHSRGRCERILQQSIWFESNQSLCRRALAARCHLFIFFSHEQKKKKDEMESRQLFSASSPHISRRLRHLFVHCRGL